MTDTSTTTEAPAAPPPTEGLRQFAERTTPAPRAIERRVTNTGGRARPFIPEIRRR